MKLSLTFPHKKSTSLLANKKTLLTNTTNNMAKEVHGKRKAAEVDTIDLTSDDDNGQTPTAKKAPRLQQTDTPVSKPTVTVENAPPTPANSQVEKSPAVTTSPTTPTQSPTTVNEPTITENPSMKISTPAITTDHATQVVTPPISCHAPTAITKAATVKEPRLNTSTTPPPAYQTTQAVTPPTNASQVVTTPTTDTDEIVETQPPQPRTKISKIAERYTTTRSSDDTIYYRDPKQFCLKPAYWRRWESQTYSRAASLLEPKLAEIATSLAAELDVPIEEATHVLRAVVLNPLYDCKQARKQGEKGMQQIFDLYNKYGTENRLWGDETKKTRGMGELSHVSEGFVHVIAAKDGVERKVPVDLLGAEDRKYLRDTLRGADLGKLLGKQKEKAMVEKLDAEAEREVLCESVEHVNEMTVPQLQRVGGREVQEVEDEWVP